MIQRFLLSMLATSFFFLPAAPALADMSWVEANVTQLMPDSIPKGAQRVQFLSVEFWAGCDDDVSVRSLKLKHDGFGRASDIERVYVLDRGARITRGGSFNEFNRTVLLRFSTELRVEACEKRTIIIAADIAADAEAAGEHAIGLESVESSAGGFTIEQTHAQESTAETKPFDVGSVDVTFLDLLNPLRYGKNRVLARLRLEAGPTANQEIHAITFTNDGKATGKDLQNLRIVNRRGKQLTTLATQMDGDRVHLTFDPPLKLDRNNEILLELKGDIHASRKRTVRFTVEEPSDLEASPAAR